MLRKLSSTGVLACVATLIMGVQSARAAGTYTADNITSDTLLSGISSAKISQSTAEIPTIAVWHDGQQYTKISPNAQVQFGFDYSASCRGLHKLGKLELWVNDNTKSGPSSYPDHLTKVWSKNLLSGSKKKSTGGAVWLGGAVPPVLEKAAIAACNARVTKRMAQGLSRQQALAEKHLIGANDIDKPVFAGALVVACPSKPNFGHAWQNLRVNYQCQGSDLGATQVPTSTAQGVQSSFFIEQVAVTANPSEYSGECPTSIFFEGNIKTSKSGTEVQYRWSHKGTFGPVATTKTNSAQTAYATYSMQVGAGAAPTAAKQATSPGQVTAQTIGDPGPAKGYAPTPDSPTAGWMQLLVMPKGETDWSKAVKSNQASYNVQCSKPLAVQAGSVPGTPPSKPPRAPGKPDVLSQGGLTLGNAFGPWGGSLSVSGAAATRQRSGQCSFRMKYPVQNSGAIATGKFDSVLRTGNLVLHTQKAMELAKGQNANASGSIWLSNGQHVLVATLDDGNAVAESNENNNVYRIQVTVRGCAEQAEPTRPRGAPAPSAPRTTPTQAPRVPRATPTQQPATSRAQQDASDHEGERGTPLLRPAVQKAPEDPAAQNPARLSAPTTSRSRAAPEQASDRDGESAASRSPARQSRESTPPANHADESRSPASRRPNSSGR